MTAHGFTADEWRLSDEPLSSFVYQLNILGYNRFCAHVMRGDDNNGNRLTDEDAHKIARLIAAAPDLLAALQKTREIIRGYMDAEYIAMDSQAKIGLGQFLDDTISAATGSRG